ncbi:hypothetical protein ACYZT4_03300 [Pseudomonas sp. GB2N2]
MSIYQSKIMALKPPNKKTRPKTPDTDPSTRHASLDDGTPIPRDSSDAGLAGLLPDDLQSSINTRPSEGGQDNRVGRQPEVAVEDASSFGQDASTSLGSTPAITFLASFLASSLTKPQTDGLRHGKHQRVYAEIENEGVTLVRRNARGEYQAASANELIASGPLLERITGTDFWRRKNTDTSDEQPGPSNRKRPRLDEDTDTSPVTESLATHLRAQDAPVLDLSAALWRNWGTSTKPLSGESVEIDSLHYRIVPHGSPERTGVAYLENPQFSPTRYAEFEQMLRDDPTLQPKWAVRKNDQWQVVESPRPFDKNLTGYVGATFRDFSDTSLSTVAKAVFNRANNADVINAFGLMVMHQTYRNWASPTRARAPRPELADPLLMLPALPVSNGLLALTVPDAGVLRRLDFAPQHFQTEWNNYNADRSDYNLKRLVGSVLVRNGYEVFPLTNEHRGPTLVFTRANHDAVFFLKLGRVEGDAIRQITPSGNELTDPHLGSRIGEPAHAALRMAFDQNKVVWLLGGTQKTAAGLESVFIIREG